eukprot:7391777-Prymnesium_polylepis.1
MWPLSRPQLAMHSRSGGAHGPAVVFAGRIRVAAVVPVEAVGPVVEAAQRVARLVALAVVPVLSAGLWAERRGRGVCRVHHGRRESH